MSLLATNVNPRLPETINKCSFNLSLVTEAWDFFSLYCLSELFLRILQELGESWGCESYIGLSQLDCKCKPGQNAVT